MMAVGRGLLVISFVFTLIASTHVTNVSSEQIAMMSYGEIISVECYAGINRNITNLEWYSKASLTEKIIPRDCESCKISSKVLGDSLFLDVTIFTSDEYGRYSCKYKDPSAGMQLIEDVIIQQKDSDNGGRKSECKHQQISARNPLSTDKFIPFCDEDGNYRNIQAKTIDDVTIFWCADLSTGNRLDGGFEQSARDLPCSVQGITLETCMMILIVVQICLFLFDMILYKVLKRGIMAHLHRTK